jgi:CBS-domain-containing membrane protein
MTTKVVTVPPETPVSEIVNLMERHRIKRMPVLQKDRVVGMVTRRSLLQGLATFVVGTKSPAVDDESLRSRILEEICKLPWTPRASLNVIVHNSAVHLWGVILDERQRKATCLAAEGVPGVKEVHDHLVWVEPVTGMSIESPEDAETAKRALADTHHA